MLRPRGIDRLTLRFALGITILVVFLLTLGLYALSTHHFRHMLDAQRRAAELQNRILETALRHQMLANDRTLIASILAEIGSQPEVQTAMILDHDGIVRFSSRPSLFGQKFSVESPECQVCHHKQPAERDRWAMLNSAGTGILRTVRPIQNRPECHRCHNRANRINGILILDVSLAEMQALMGADRFWIISLGVVFVLSIGFLVRRLIIVRLAKLGEATRAFTAGRITERANVGGDDTIGALARDFNHMAATTADLVSEVRQRETQLANVMNSLDDGLIVLDRHLQIVAMNHAFSKRLGLEAEAARGRKCRSIIQGVFPCGQTEPECPSGRCFSSGKVQRFTFYFPSPDEKSGRVEEVHASPIFDQDGKVAQVVEIWRDITDRVKEETRLAEFERLECLGVLASGFSHEVNTPLASILTCSDAILDRIRESSRNGTQPALLEEIGSSAGTISEQVLRCRKITEQFLRFSRGVPPSKEPVDLKSVVASIVPVLDPTARQKGITLRTIDTDGVPIVIANTEVVQHVLLNVLINAIQACDGKGGTVSVSYRVDSDVRVCVQDTGRGISAGERKHLFEPFRTSRPQGTGVGLFLSRSFMRRFGGDIELVDRAAGRGCCFEIVFLRPREHAL